MSFVAKAQLHVISNEVAAQQIRNDSLICFKNNATIPIFCQ